MKKRSKGHMRVLGFNERKIARENFQKHNFELNNKTEHKIFSMAFNSGWNARKRLNRRSLWNKIKQTFIIWKRF